MGVIRRMGKEGDTETRWSVGNDGEIKIAKERFDESIKRGMLAFSLESLGKCEGEQIMEFDPNANEIVLIPKIAGG